MAFLRAVHEKVNIIPVIGKADALMPKETQALKQKVCLVTSDLWPYMKPKVVIKPEISFDFFDLGKGSKMSQTTLQERVSEEGG